ncbi:uncharacterized protein LOC120677573 [Panicum virgatum]|uniref:CCT domain-containing protein n=1 Tax=Panicum virgatum TaxID=38727 RepID=A0A8T0QTD6_PANVG|nr:uncharacterized protein LOC120677573 [Panicum virgatum]KAG2576406.1 hypothetical protein PVAP13_6NG020300 [Panicum virgatum]KAG2576407.1 hypothetical protein PVAP13_6NG020300 [Panicum virgatum]
MASGGGGRRRKPRPRARGKGKKTKYLSLSDLLIKAEVGTPPRSPGDEPAPAWEEAEVKREDGGDGAGQQQQVEPFPLHHEASTLFAALPAPSLSDILGASAGGTDESPSPSASPDGGSGFTGAEEEDLARRALRGRERWVYCSSGSSPTATTATTATTSSSSPCSSAASTGASARSLLLKLDHEEILAAWADRGSLYIGGGADSDAAPELGLDAVLVEVEPSEHAAGAPPSAACAWSAREMAPAGPERAEKVRRYKEKRRNRLFARRIRYEVRRVNAVKRPRFKGRFIKEHEESELQPT